MYPTAPTQLILPSPATPAQWDILNSQMIKPLRLGVMISTLPTIFPRVASALLRENEREDPIIATSALASCTVEIDYPTKGKS